MKRILSLLLILALLMSALAACGSDYDTPPEGFLEETSKPKEEAPAGKGNYEIPIPEELDYNYELSEYITLPDYLSESFIFSDLPLDDASIQNDIEYLKLYSTSATITDVERKAQAGDLVYFNYAAYDENDEGVISGKNVVLIMGKDFFAPGFDNYVLGLGKNMKAEFNYTFPAGWKNISGVAGKTLRFTVETTKVAELVPPTLETVIAEQGCKNEAELKEMLVENRINNNAYNFFDAIVSESTVIKYPEKEFEYYKALSKRGDEQKAKVHGVPLESIIQSDYGSVEAFEEAKAEYAEESCRRDLVIYALKERYGFKMTKEEYNLVLEEYHKENGASMGLKGLDDAYEKMGFTIAMSLYSEIAAKAVYSAR